MLFAFSSKISVCPDGTGMLSGPVFPSPAMPACLLSCAGHGISLISLSVTGKTMSQRPLDVTVLQTNNYTKDTFVSAAAKMLNYCRE